MNIYQRRFVSTSVFKMLIQRTFKIISDTRTYKVVLIRVRQYINLKL